MFNSGVKFFDPMPDGQNYHARYAAGKKLSLGGNVVIDAGAVLIGANCDNVLIGAITLVISDVPDFGGYVGVLWRKIANSTRDVLLIEAISVAERADGI